MRKATQRVVAAAALVLVVSACGGAGSQPGSVPDTGATVSTIRATPRGAVDLTRSVVGDLEERNDALYGD